MSCRGGIPLRLKKDSPQEVASPRSFQRNTMPRRPLQTLFWETRAQYPDSNNIKYTLKDQDHNGYPSLYRLYMEMEDTTEWEFAQAYLEDYQHWMALCECTWFKAHAERWRHELQQKLRARALRSIKQVANDDQKDSYAANKYLLDKGYATPEPPSSRRGRPSKDHIAREARRLAEEANIIKEDSERLTSNGRPE